MQKLPFYVLIVFYCAMAHAIEPMTCRNGFFPAKQDALQLATIKEKIYFYNDEEGCPEKASCKQKAYLIANDTVIVNNVSDGWACAWYSGKKRETVGWLKVGKLQFQNVKQTDWTGKWQFYDNTLALTQTNGKIQVSGEAFWTGLIINGQPNIHTGNINGELSIHGNHASVAEGTEEFSCHADLTLLNNYLIVHDNHNCGGANVSFSGVYQKNR